LVVEDDPGIAELERGRLEEAGYQVTLAGTAEEASALVRAGGIDLVLLDYRLPGGVDGLDFYGRLQADGFDLPVILVTGFSDEGVVIQALRSRVRDFVTKSLEYLNYLPEAVGRVIRQVRIEQRLAESEASLGAVIESAKDAIIVAGPDRRITMFNPAAERMFRCPAADARGRPLTRFIPNEYGPIGGYANGSEEISVSQSVRTGTRGIRNDGEEFPLEASVSRAEVRGQKFHTVVVRDISERRRAEEALRASKEEWEQSFNALTDNICIVNRSGTILRANKTMRDRFEPLHGNLDGLDYRVIYCGSATCVPQPPCAAVLTDGSAFVGEMALPMLEGWYQVASYPLADPGGARVGAVSVVRDLTERKHLEQQLRQAQKMEVVGQLAGGVAHDFNNMLTVINGFSDLTLAQLDAAHPVRDMVEEIRRAGERATGLTRQLLTLSRQQVVAPKVLNINTVVAEATKMLRQLIGADVQLVTRLDPALRLVKADAGQIEQVVMNLAVNARDAMPTGGRLTVETLNSDLDAEAVAAHPRARPGPYVLLRVTDTGHGMSDAVKARIFEPFFTTKDIGKGTGLGLATVFGIAEQSGGHMEVESETGRGTAFSVYLPATAETLHGTGTHPILREVPRGHETILLVEDDASLRSFAVTVLRGAGYTVLKAGEGAGALTVCERHDGPIDILVTDSVMPGMGGRQLAERVAILRPSARVLYMSGYTSDAAVRHGVEQARTAYLQKPFTPAALIGKVREVLDSRL